MKKFLSILLSLCLGLFLVDAALSLLDDSLILFFGIRALAGFRGIASFFSFMAGLLVYLLIGITPMVPKRFFLPVALFIPAGLLGSIPLSIYYLELSPQIAWFLSIIQVVLALGITGSLQGGLKLKWPLLREDQLEGKAFGWLNTSGFVLLNVFALAPAVFLYLGWCSSRAVDHFSGGFLALHADSLAVRAREYVRQDGKTIHLIPMMHIGEPEFYQRVLASIPTNSAILLEGVTDRKNLLEKKLSYKKMASSLGLSEQHEQFEPSRGRPRPADVDVDQFSAKSIEFLKLATLVHTTPLTAKLLVEVIQKSEDPLLPNQLWEDLLTRRNNHLLKEIEAELRLSDVIVVPWGAAHMRGLAEGIEKSGFRPAKTNEYKILHFRTIWKGLHTPVKAASGIEPAGNSEKH